MQLPSWILRAFTTLLNSVPESSTFSFQVTQEQMLGNLNFPIRVFGPVHSFVVAQDVTHHLLLPLAHSRQPSPLPWVVKLPWITKYILHNKNTHRLLLWLLMVSCFKAQSLWLGMEDFQHHQLLTNCTQTDPLHYGFGNISPLGFFIISSRQQQYSPISELWMPASVCCCAAIQPCWGSLHGFNPKMNFEECCQTFTTAPKSINCPSLPTLVAFLIFLFVVCFFFCWIIQLIGWHWSTWELLPNEGSSLPAFYLSSRLTANPTLLTNHHGRAVAMQNKMLLS